MLTKNSAGDDGLSIKMLKLSANEIAPCLAAIFNQSLSTGLFPTGWKNALVTPVYKCGSRYDMSNYRPIALLSAVSKVFECLVHTQLQYFLNENHILTEQ